MGLFTQLVLLPLAPVRGVVWLAEQLQRQAELELYGPEALQRRLVEVEELFDSGEISADERDLLEQDLLSRLAPEDRHDDF